MFIEIHYYLRLVVHGKKASPSGGGSLIIPERQDHNARFAPTFQRFYSLPRIENQTFHKWLIVRAAIVKLFSEVTAFLR